MKALQLTLLALLASCAPDASEHDGSSTAAADDTPEASTAAAASNRRPGSWSSQQLIEGEDWADGNWADGNWADGVSPSDGERNIVWELELGEGIESLEYGILGSGGGEAQSTVQLNGATRVALSLAIREATPEELPADGAASEHPEGSAREWAALMYEVGFSAVATGGGEELVRRDEWAVTSASRVPGTLRDPEAWGSSARKVIGSCVGEVGEPSVLASEFWVDGGVTLGEERARIVPGEKVGVSFTYDGERMELSDCPRPAWVFYVLAR